MRRGESKGLPCAGRLRGEGCRAAGTRETRGPVREVETDGECSRSRRGSNQQEVEKRLRGVHWSQVTHITITLYWYRHAVVAMSESDSRVCCESSFFNRFVIKFGFVFGLQVMHIYKIISISLELVGLLDQSLLPCYEMSL